MSTQQLEKTETKPVCTTDGVVFTPAADVYETETEFVVRMDMPGVSADCVDIQFEQGELVVHGCVKDRRPTESKFLRQEFQIGDFDRSFRVGDVVNPDGIDAQFANGVLTITLPKREEVKRKRIAVRPSQN